MGGSYDIKFEDGERKRGITESQIEGGGDDDRDRDRDSRSSSSSAKKRREGDRVKAKVSGWTKFYSGEITRVNSDGTYDIKFDDGERRRGVTESQIEGGGSQILATTETRNEIIQLLIDSLPDEKEKELEIQKEKATLEE